MYSEKGEMVIYMNFKEILKTVNNEQRVVVIYIYAYFTQNIPHNIIQFKDQKTSISASCAACHPSKPIIPMDRNTICCNFNEPHSVIQHSLHVFPKILTTNTTMYIRKKLLTGFALQCTWNIFFLSDRKFVFMQQFCLG